MKRAVLLSTCVAAALLATGTPAHAESMDNTTAASPDRTTTVQRMDLSDSSLVTLSSAQVTGADPAASVTPLVDPPGEGCDYSDVHGEVLSSYLDGVLATTETTYFSSILCTTTAPGQLMDGLISQASLFLNTVKIDEGTEGICADCNLASSSGSHVCAGQANCAGSYFVGAIAEMKLPEGWIWSGTVPDNCQRISEAWLRCAATTNSVYVSPTH